jgi:hypothetical protein
VLRCSARLSLAGAVWVLKVWSRKRRGSMTSQRVGWLGPAELRQFERNCRRRRRLCVGRRGGFFEQSYHFVPFRTMNEKTTKIDRTGLALALAQGSSPAKWARVNGVPKNTAYRWASDPKVREAAESFRQVAFDQARGRISRRAVWAADGIVNIAMRTESDSLRLRALLAIVSGMCAASAKKQSVKKGQAGAREERAAKRARTLSVVDGASSIDRSPELDLLATEGARNGELELGAGREEGIPEPAGDDYGVVVS